MEFFILLSIFALFFMMSLWLHSFFKNKSKEQIIQFQDRWQKLKRIFTIFVILLTLNSLAFYFSSPASPSTGMDVIIRGTLKTELKPDKEVTLIQPKLGLQIAATLISEKVLNDEFRYVVSVPNPTLEFERMLIQDHEWVIVPRLKYKIKATTTSQRVQHEIVF
jgi:hypothetical protein